MRILFLDDNKERHKAFQQRSIGCNVDCAFNAKEAIGFLGGETDYDLIMLDHDLGGPEQEGQVIDGAEDGRMVASFIASNSPRHKGTTIVIHSLNTAGAVIMQMILNTAGFRAERVPFGWKVFEKVETGGCRFVPVQAQHRVPKEIDSCED